MPARHLPPDHSKGDESTLGGYAAVHARPAAFEGIDGMSYSVDVVVDETGEAGRDAYAGFLLFVRWRRIGEPGVEGHLESDYLSSAATEAEARAALAALPLAEVKRTLDDLIRARRGWGPAGDAPSSSRPWWEVMRDEGEA